MADKPVTEVVAVDAVLDALSSPTSSDVYEALGPYSNDAVAAVAAKRAAAGGGGGSQTVYVQDADPGAVGAGKVWVTVTDSPPVMRIRDDADADWSPAVLKQLGPLLEDLDGGGKDITNVGTFTAATVNVSDLVGDGGGWDVGGAKISGVDDPASDQQAATKAYVDSGAAARPLAEVLASGDDANGLNIANLADPTDAQQAATKAYVDSLSGWTTITKLTDQAVINSATLTPDDTLFLALTPSTKYRLRGVIFFDTTALGDFRYSLNPDSPALSRVFDESVTPDLTALQVNVTVDGVAGGPLAGDGTTGGYLRFDAIITSPVGSSTFRFFFAQSSATNDTGAIVRAGSYIEYAVVA